MKKIVPTLILILLIAGCSSLRPKNLPKAGEGPTLAASMTQYAQTATAAVTAGPGTVVTTAPGATAPGAATTPGPVTNVTPVPPVTGGQGPVTTEVSPSTGGAPASAGTSVPAGTAASAVNIPLSGDRTPIQFAQNASAAVVTIDLGGGTVKAYQFVAQQGQHLYITIDGDASFTLYDPNLAPFGGVLTAINPVRLNLTNGGTYYIALSGSGPVTMSIYIPATNADWKVQGPIPASLTPIQFAQGATSASIAPTLTQGTPVGYSIAAQAGQQINVTTEGGVIPFLFGQDKTWIPSAQAPTHEWTFTPLPQTQTYTLVLLGNGPAKVTVNIPPLSVPQTGGQGTPIPMPGSPTRVTFGPGNASTVVNANLTAGQPQGYVLSIQAGQTLYVSTTGVVDITIYGPDKKVLVSGHSDYPDNWSAKAAQAGDYTFVISGSGPSTLTFYVPPQ